jgi:hypothetical protein
MRVISQSPDPLARMHTMTKRQGKSGTIDVKALLREDEEFLRALVRTGTGIFGSDCVERARLPDDAVHDHNRARRDHSGCSETRIGDCVCTPHDDCVGHNLGPFAIWARRKHRAV